MNTDYNDEANSRANAGQELPDCSIARAIEIEVTEGSKPNKFKKATDSSKDNSNERKKRTNASKDDYNENPDPIRPTTSMFVNLPYMPADSPLCCPHVMDLTQERLTDGIIEGTLQISRADIVATILYNHGEETLKTFFDFDNYEYVEFKSHKYIRKPGSEKEELLSLLIIRAWDYVYFSKINNAENFDGKPVPWIYDRYKWKVTPDPAEPWVLKTYDTECLTNTPWQMIREWKFSIRGLGFQFTHYRNPTLHDVPWMFDMMGGGDLSEEWWKEYDNAESGMCTKITIRKAEKMKDIDPQLSRAQRDVVAS